ncbi:MAG: FecR domain-containing protein [Prolixibacteraceae bacterium]
MEDKDYLYNLMSLEYSGQLDKQQNNDLQSWLEASPENLAEYKEIANLLSFSDRLVAMKKIDAGKDLMIVRKKLNQGGNSNRLLLTFQRIAAILILPLLVFTIWSPSHVKEMHQLSIAMRCAETSFGVRSQIQMSDGTLVWMNSGSKLTYPEYFDGDTREVKLTGEAYFQVKSDSEHPFYVDLNGYKIKATGTRFNISNYAGDKEISTFLEHGKVSMLMGSEEEHAEPVTLNENQIIVLNKSHKSYKIQNTDGSKYLGWIKGLLILKKDSINNVADRLGRWYNAEIVYDDKLARSGYVFTATFKQETLEEAMKLLSYCTPINYKIIQGTQLKDSSFSKRKVIITKK